MCFVMPMLRGEPHDQRVCPVPCAAHHGTFSGLRDPLYLTLTLTLTLLTWSDDVLQLLWVHTVTKHIVWVGLGRHQDPRGV